MVSPNYGVVLYYYPRLPAVIPIHFNALGRPDAWGSKSTMMSLLYVSIGLYGVFTLLGFFVQYVNYSVKVTVENAVRLYPLARLMTESLKLEILLMLLYTTWGMIQVAIKKANGLSGWLLPVFLVVLGISLIYFISATLKAQ